MIPHRSHAKLLGALIALAWVNACSDTPSSVTVTPPPPVRVGSVTVTPATASILARQTVQLSAGIRGANGNVLGGRTISWATNNAAVATVDTNGLVRGVSQGSAAVTATSEGVSDTALITVTVFTFASVTTGQWHTCGVTTGGAAYCWGDNTAGQLGHGSVGPDKDSVTPVAVSGGLSFATLVAGGYRTCGLTKSGAAYCWGDDRWSQVGDGTMTDSRTTPVAVQGGRSFAAVSAGAAHSCGITAAGAVYCWGRNTGELGDGTTTARTTPVAVQGGLIFAAVSTGNGPTCGVAAGGAAYCWGGNTYGQLGDGTTTDRTTPMAVQGGLTFAAVTAGAGYTCGLTTGGAAYCWGSNVVGELGDGWNTNQPTPVAVQGGLTFTTVSGGNSHNCGVTTGGAAYCWGSDYYGELGNGDSVGGRYYPKAVQGGLTFAAVSAGGGNHTCGITTGGVAYCWGYNFFRQLGDGTNRNSSVPVKVAGQP